MSTEPRTSVEAYRELMPLMLDMNDAQKRRMLEMAKEWIAATLAAIDRGGVPEEDPELLTLRGRFIEEDPELARASLLVLVALLTRKREETSDG